MRRSYDANQPLEHNDAKSSRSQQLGANHGKQLMGMMQESSRLREESGQKKDQERIKSIQELLEEHNDPGEWDPGEALNRHLAEARKMSGLYERSGSPTEMSGLYERSGSPTDRNILSISGSRHRGDNSSISVAEDMSTSAEDPFHIRNSETLSDLRISYATDSPNQNSTRVTNSVRPPEKISRELSAGTAEGLLPSAKRQRTNDANIPVKAIQDTKDAENFLIHEIREEDLELYLRDRQKEIQHLFTPDENKSFGENLQMLSTSAKRAIEQYIYFTHPILEKVSPSFKKNGLYNKTNAISQFNRYYLGIDEKVKGVIALYKGEDYRQLNDYCLQPDFYDPEECVIAEQRVSILNNFLQQHSLPVSTILIRDTTNKRFKPYTFFTHGESYFQSKAFISTSINPCYQHDETMEETNKQDIVRFFIDAPEGTKGALIDHPQLYFGRREQEFLLPRSSIIKIEQQKKLDDSSFTNQDHEILSALPRHLIHGTCN